jgi:outer membrane protein assembly factor BamB
MRRRDFLSGSVLTYCAATTVTTGIVYGIGTSAAPEEGDAPYAGEVARWKFGVPGDGPTGFGDLTVADGTVFTTVENEGVYAVDATDGTERWHLDVDSPRRSGLTTANGNVFVVGGNQGGVAYAVDAETGAVEWQRDAGWEAYWPVVVEDTVVVPGTGYYDGEIHAFDRGSGEVHWTVRTSGVVAVADDVLLVSDGGRTLCGVDIATGEQRWEYRVEEQRDFRTAVGTADGKFVVAAAYDLVLAVDAETGELLWRHEPDRGDHTFVGGVNDGVVYGEIGNRVVAIDSTDGTKLWELSDEGGFTDVVVASGAQRPWRRWGLSRDVLFFVEGERVVIVSEFGERLGGVQGGSSIEVVESSVGTADGTLYFAHENLWAVPIDDAA